MGRRPEPTSDKIARGTYHPDRDKSMTVALAGDTPQMPEGLGAAGMQFWSETHARPQVPASTRNVVMLISWIQDEREAIAAQFFQTPANQWRQQTTPNDTDRDIFSGLGQLLFTPNSRRRAGIETVDADKHVLSPLELLVAKKLRSIAQEEQEWRKNWRNSAGV